MPKKLSFTTVYRCCMIDYNHSTDRALSVGDLEEKFKSFGWESSYIDGHNHDQIFKALTRFSKNRPIAIIAETIKGFGCRRMESNPEWHHKSPSSEELNEILEELA